MIASVGRVDTWFARQAGLTPDAVAVIVAGRVVSYRELDGLANAVAARLADHGVGVGDFVGVLLDRDERLIAVLLGVLKSGAAYVPLDPTYPAQRLQFVAADTDMSAVLTSKALHNLAAEIPATTLIVDDIDPCDAPPAAHGGPDDAAYVIYTSGSTGQPKGVVVEHHSVVNLLRWSAQAFTADELAGVLAATSICFDVSVVELFTPLVTGGTIVMAENILALPDLPDGQRVRLVFGVPSALAAVVGFAWPAGIRTVVPAGEALSRALADRLYAQPGVERVVNCFGPTECTVYCAAAEVPRHAEAEPAIGVPVAGAELSVRDPETGEPLAPGEEGELWVAGPGLAREYLRRPELTAQRFVSDGQSRWYRTGDRVRLRSGAYEYLGRLDDQVKIRGHRVEPGELQAALLAHPAVRQAAVLCPADEAGNRYLVGYVVPATATLSESELRAWLRGRLPGYLLPSSLVFLDDLPLGPTGKLDRAALPAPAARSGAAKVAPATALEALVAEVMADVLGLPEVGATDRFGDLGGHSLAAAHVVASVAARLGRPVPMGWFLAEPTAAALARRISTDVANAEPVSSIPIRHEGQHVFPLTDLQRELWVTRQVHPDASTTVALKLHLRGDVKPDTVATALSGVVRRHEVVRTCFEESDNGPIAVVRPPTDVPFTQVDVPDRVGSPQDAIAATIGHVFDIHDEVPLMRAALVRTAPDEAELYLAIDHMAFDGYSVGILLTELAATLAGRTVGGPPLQVGDLARFERSQAEDLAARERVRTFWQATLARSGRAELAAEGRRAGRGARVIRLLDPALAARVDATVRALGVSRFAGYAAALAVLLRGLTGEPVPVIGTGAALRDRPGLDRVIGPLVRVLPIPVDTSDDPSFLELAVRAGAATAAAVSHQDVPSEELARCASFDRPPGAALCPVILTMQPEGMPTVVDAGGSRVSFAGELPAGMASTDLTFFVDRLDVGTQVQVEYDVGLFQESDVEALLDLWLRVLDGVTGDPSAPISTVAPSAPWAPTAAVGGVVPAARSRAIEQVARVGAGGPPASELERFVAEVWAEVLEVALDDIGRGSEFFALGGNSFAATRVVARLRAVLECQLPVRTLFERSVLADFADELEHAVLTQMSTID